MGIESSPSLRREEERQRRTACSFELISHPVFNTLQLVRPSEGRQDQLEGVRFDGQLTNETGFVLVISVAQRHRCSSEDTGVDVDLSTVLEVSRVQFGRGGVDEVECDQREKPACQPCPVPLSDEAAGRARRESRALSLLSCLVDSVRRAEQTSKVDEQSTEVSPSRRFRRLTLAGQLTGSFAHFVDE